MTDVKPGDVAERLERFADAIASDAYNADPWKAEDAASDAPFLRTAASLIRSLSERVEKLEGALLALEPFAMAANCLFERDSDGIIFGLVHAPLGMPVPLNYGHLRKAKAAYDAALERK